MLSHYLSLTGGAWELWLLFGVEYSSDLTGDGPAPAEEQKGDVTMAVPTAEVELSESGTESPCRRVLENFTLTGGSVRVDLEQVTEPWWLGPRVLVSKTCLGELAKRKSAVAREEREAEEAAKEVRKRKRDREAKKKELQEQLAKLRDESPSPGDEVPNTPTGEESPPREAVVCRKVLTSSQAPPSKGDWTCVACGYQNFKRNKTCRACEGKAEGSALVESGKDPAGKDGWKPGDWKCRTCGFHNFAKNKDCKQCSKSGGGGGGGCDWSKKGDGGGGEKWKSKDVSAGGGGSEWSSKGDGGGGEKWRSKDGGGGGSEWSDKGDGGGGGEKWKKSTTWYSSSKSW